MRTRSWTRNWPRRSRAKLLPPSPRCRAGGVDGYVLEMVSDPPFPYAVAVVTDAEGEQDEVTVGSSPVLWHFLNRLSETLPTPNPHEADRNGND